MKEIIFWAVMLVVFVIAESATAQLVCIWFAVGSLFSLIVSLFTDSITIQLVTFIVVSIVLLLLTRPFLRRFINTKHIATNADAFIGKEGFSTEEINNLRNKGRVLIDGLSWAARSQNEEIIPSQTKIVICKIEGVTAFVRVV